MVKQMAPLISNSNAHCGHFLDLLRQLWEAVAAIPIHPQSCYEEIIFTFELCNHTHEVKSCIRFL